MYLLYNNRETSKKYYKRNIWDPCTVSLHEHALFSACSMHCLVHGYALFSACFDGVPP